MATIDAASRHDLSDAQWALLEPLLPAPARRGRPRRWPVRGLVDGVRHRTREGCPWRDVPQRYGPWWRVYALFACWQVLAVWQRVEDALRARADAVGKLSWQVSVDSTTARAHIHAAGARRDSFGSVAGEPDTRTFKKTFGYHPIGVWCDNTGEFLAASLRAGNAGSNTTTDHLDVLARAIAQVPAGHRKNLLVRELSPR